MSERTPDFYKPTPEEIAKRRQELHESTEHEATEERSVPFTLGQEVAVNRTNSGLESGWVVVEEGDNGHLTVEKTLPNGDVMMKQYTADQLKDIQERAEIQSRSEVAAGRTPEAQAYAEQRIAELDAHYGIEPEDVESLENAKAGAYYKSLSAQAPEVYYYNYDPSSYNAETGIVKLMSNSGNVAYRLLAEVLAAQDSLKAEKEQQRAHADHLRKAGAAILKVTSLQ